MSRLLALVLAFAAIPAFADSASYTVVYGGTKVGHVKVDTTGNRAAVDFNIKNNGRGPTMAETITFGTDGLPTSWNITGTTTFGSKVNETFSRNKTRANWFDSTGKGEAPTKEPAIYVAQQGSPWSLQIYSRALLKAPGMTMRALPGGTLKLEKRDTISVDGKGGPVEVTRYELSGIKTDPQTMLLDAKGDFFASVTPDVVIVRDGYEAEEVRLRKLAADWSTERFALIRKEIAHDYGAPVRIRNVRVFDPKTSALTAPVSVVVNGKTIAAIEVVDSPATPGEVTVDGAGGTLVAGMYEMHGHLDQNDALLNVLAGITSVRDMGSDNAVLDSLVRRIDSGEIAGPHVIRSGFIEGKSQFSANNGIVVDSQEKALDAVRWYAARGFWQIKSYNSMNPEWVPAMVKEAHSLGMRVAGHVPAFSSADKMLEAGFDEITHINQFVLGWLLAPEEDTRTIFRITALKRLARLDLNDPKVQHTIDLMVKGKKAIDPTLGIHENGLTNRDGIVPAGAVDYFSHMPIGVQRDAKKAWMDTSAPGDDLAYKQAFEKLLQVVKQLHDRGVFIVFGTDTGGSFTYHRELELYQRAGFTAPEILKRATFESARYIGEEQSAGSIEKGKRADFFLVPGDPTKDLKAIKTISMVVKDGVFYYPTEAYPKFGIEPFTTKPKVTLP